MSQGPDRANYRRYQSAVVAHPGQLLREAREAAGIDQRELAEELYLTLHYVQAIEAGEFSRLPGATFVRGYLRSYAKRMGIPEHRVLELYEEYLRDRAEQEGRVRRGTSDAERWQRRVWRGMGILLLVLVVLGMYNVISPAPEPEAGGEAATRDVAPAKPEADRGDSLTANPATSDDEASDAEAAPDDRMAAIRLEHREEAGAAARDGTPAAPAVQPAAGTVDRFEQRASALEMHFYADCWIQVKDASGATIAFGVKHAGEAVSLEGESPYSVRIGNVRGAKLIFNGEEVDLRAYAVNNTANFVLN